MAERTDWKQRAKNLSAKLRSGGGKLAAGGKGSAMAAGTGALLYELEFRGLSKIETLNDPEKWWLKPVLYILAGHFAKRKNATIGAALLGAGGYAGAQSYEIHSQSKPAEGVSRTWADAGQAGALGDSVYARRDNRMGQGNGYGNGYAGGGPVAQGVQNNFSDAGAMSDPLHGWNQPGG